MGSRIHGRLQQSGAVVYYSEQRRQIFLHSPKCAGIAVGEWLCRNFGYRHYKAKLDIVPGLPVPVIEQHRYTVPEEFAGYTVWTTCRDPASRWESFYRYSVESGTTEDRDFAAYTAACFGYLVPQIHYLQSASIWVPYNAIEFYCAEKLGLETPVPLPRQNVSDSSICIRWTAAERRIILDNFAEDFKMLRGWMH